MPSYLRALHSVYYVKLQGCCSLPNTLTKSKVAPTCDSFVKKLERRWHKSDLRYTVLCKLVPSFGVNLKKD